MVRGQRSTEKTARKGLSPSQQRISSFFKTPNAPATPAQKKIPSFFKESDVFSNDEIFAPQAGSSSKATESGPSNPLSRHDYPSFSVVISPKAESAHQTPVSSPKDHISDSEDYSSDSSRHDDLSPPKDHISDSEGYSSDSSLTETDDDWHNTGDDPEDIAFVTEFNQVHNEISDLDAIWSNSTPNFWKTLAKVLASLISYTPCQTKNWQADLATKSLEQWIHIVGNAIPEDLRMLLDRDTPPCVEDLLALPWISTTDRGSYGKVMTTTKEGFSNALYVGSAIGVSGLNARRSSHLCLSGKKPKSFFNMLMKDEAARQAYFFTIARIPEMEETPLAVHHAQLVSMLAEAVMTTWLGAYMPQAGANIQNICPWPLPLGWIGACSHSALQEGVRSSLSKDRVREYRKLRSRRWKAGRSKETRERENAQKNKHRAQRSPGTREKILEARRLAKKMRTPEEIERDREAWRKYSERKQMKSEEFKKERSVRRRALYAANREKERAKERERRAQMSPASRERYLAAKRADYYKHAEANKARDRARYAASKLKKKAQSNRGSIFSASKGKEKEASEEGGMEFAEDTEGEAGD